MHAQWVMQELTPIKMHSGEQNVVFVIVKRYMIACTALVRPFNNETFDHTCIVQIACVNCRLKRAFNVCKVLNYSCFDCNARCNVMCAYVQMSISFECKRHLQFIHIRIRNPRFKQHWQDSQHEKNDIRFPKCGLLTDDDDETEYFSCIYANGKCVRCTWFTWCVHSNEVNCGCVNCIINLNSCLQSK